jgi:hypothetical protein
LNTKLILTTSAVFLGLAGIGLSFLPKEIAIYFNSNTNEITTLFIQLMGALYLGFGIMNWMAKGTIIGGIYNRPIAIGNFMHFGVGAITLAKVVFGVREHTGLIISLTVIYMVFALSFAYIFMTNPVKLDTKK